MKRGSTSRLKTTKRSKNGAAAGSQHGTRRSRGYVKVPEELAMGPGQDEELGVDPEEDGLVPEREERATSQPVVIVDERADRDQEKLQAELSAERTEGKASKKVLVEHSTSLLIVEDELAAEVQNHAFQQKIIERQTKDLTEYHEKLVADIENHKNMEKKIAETESELQKLTFNLRTAKTRASCFSCDAPRNALCMPCLHMFFCMKCQASLKERKCRFCEIPIVGVLECFH